MLGPSSSSSSSSASSSLSPPVPPSLGGVPSLSSSLSPSFPSSLTSSSLLRRFPPLLSSSLPSPLLSSNVPSSSSSPPFSSSPTLSFTERGGGGEGGPCCPSPSLSSPSVSLLLSFVVLCLIVNVTVSVYIIASIDREKHFSTDSIGPSKGGPLVPSLPSSVLLVCPLTFPLTSCGPSASIPSDALTALKEEVQSTLQDIRTLRSHSLLMTQQPPPPFPRSTPSTTSPLPFLYIGIPTVARSSPTASFYLNASLESIKSQLPIDPSHPLFGLIHVLVMNQSPSSSPHLAFDEARRLYEGDPSPAFPFHFLSNPNTLTDATPQSKDSGSPNVPGYKVRKQTRDIVATAQAALGQSRFYMFMEDDFVLCPHTIPLLQYMIDKATRYHPHPFSYKFSFGMNGFMVANDGDLQHFLDYLLGHQRLRPPDHLLTEWSAGEKESSQYKQGRPHMVYRYNLLHHLGTHSSLREEKNGEYPVCWHEMNTEVVFEVESFRKGECAHDDLWPCWTEEEVKRANNAKAHISTWMPPFNIPDTDIAEAQLKL